VRIVAVETAAQLAEIRELFQEYWSSFGFTPCFQNFSEELAALPGAYVPPGGALLLARVEGETAGCGALRRLDDERCEMKRLYVRPRFRGGGTGGALATRLVDEARRLGYGELVLDTMPAMERALAMYARMGFEGCAPYSEDATPGAVYLRLRL
jgi:putative acetyltransferase